MENLIPIPIFTSDHFLTWDILQASDREACPQPVLKTKSGAGFRECPGACYIPGMTFPSKFVDFVLTLDRVLVKPS